jgi:hypothetical protein
MARLIIIPLGELCTWPFHSLSSKNEQAIKLAAEAQGKFIGMVRILAWTMDSHSLT